MSVSLHSLAGITKTVLLFLRVLAVLECTFTTSLARDTLTFTVGITKEVATIVTSDFVTFINITQYLNTGCRETSRDKLQGIFTSR